MAKIRDLVSVFPAHAGVILDVDIANAYDKCVSRTRGGDPTSNVEKIAGIQCFPHTRG